ncbi:hypothetical protein D8674_024800 [Pyrus ussuriensis x Pyrus communis]|uniref:HAT C-terminal dimerisation domain-containing protein n=1 Tax=Pyrus ussuriensis x Pyrus communis TaxID=2448454 RepID=A0A5N5H4Y3_9ROSA|nr:hypothetical protein D8674_024800 [Pyrus ussuriensis x Pyrus communis]
MVISMKSNFVYGVDEVTELTNGIKDVLVQLYDFYLKSNEQAPQAPNVGSSSSNVPMEIADGSSIEDVRLSQFLKIRKHRKRVAFESAFSTKWHIHDDYWSFLTPQMVEALIRTQNWLKSSHISSKVESSFIEEMEIHEQIISGLHPLLNALDL